MNLSEIQIDRDALRHNVQALKALMRPGVALIGVVKGNAYGHGMTTVVPILDDLVDGFQIDDIDELRRLRAVTSKRTLVLGYVSQSDIWEAVSLDAELAIYDVERMAEINRVGLALGRRPKVHLKIDALLGRQGVIPDELPNLIDELRKWPAIDLKSVYAHFANIEDTTDLDHAILQKEILDQCVTYVRANGFPTVGRHISATSGLMTIEDGSDLVRVGVGLYGMYPSSPLAERHSQLDLKPVMRWVSHLAQVKTLPANHPVGYGLTYRTDSPLRVGVVPQGYSDGFGREFSSNGEVLVRGQRCPVLGRVAMNMFTVDLSQVPDAVAEDEVVLLGQQGERVLSAEELASRSGTINYEITTRVSALLPRRIIGSD